MPKPDWKSLKSREDARKFSEAFRIEAAGGEETLRELAEKSSLLYQLGIEAFNQASYKGALKLFEECGETRGDYTEECFQKLFETCMKLGRFREAGGFALCSNNEEFKLTSLVSVYANLGYDYSSVTKSIVAAIKDKDLQSKYVSIAKAECPRKANFDDGDLRLTIVRMCQPEDCKPAELIFLVNHAVRHFSLRPSSMVEYGIPTLFQSGMLIYLTEIDVSSLKVIELYSLQEILGLFDFFGTNGTAFYHNFMMTHEEWLHHNFCFIGSFAESVVKPAVVMRLARLERGKMSRMFKVFNVILNGHVSQCHIAAPFAYRVPPFDNLLWFARALKLFIFEDLHNSSVMITEVEDDFLYYPDPSNHHYVEFASKLKPSLANILLMSIDSAIAQQEFEEMQSMDAEMLAKWDEAMETLITLTNVCFADWKDYLFLKNHSAAKLPPVTEQHVLIRFIKFLWVPIFEHNKHKLKQYERVLRNPAVFELFARQLNFFADQSGANALSNAGQLYLTMIVEILHDAFLGSVPLPLSMCRILAEDEEFMEPLLYCSLQFTKSSYFSNFRSKTDLQLMVIDDVVGVIAVMATASSRFRAKLVRSGRVVDLMPSIFQLNYVNEYSVHSLAVLTGLLNNQDQSAIVSNPYTFTYLLRLLQLTDSRKANSNARLNGFITIANLFKLIKLDKKTAAAVNQTPMSLVYKLATYIHETSASCSDDPIVLSTVLAAGMGLAAIFSNSFKAENKNRFAKSSSFAPIISKYRTVILKLQQITQA